MLDHWGGMKESSEAKNEAFFSENRSCCLYWHLRAIMVWYVHQIGAICVMIRNMMRIASLFVGTSVKIAQYLSTWRHCPPCVLQTDSCCKQQQNARHTVDRCGRPLYGMRFFLSLLLRQTAPREQWQKGTAFCHPVIRVCRCRLVARTWRTQHTSMGLC